MISAIEILTFLWLALWALIALKALVQGNQSPILVVILVHIFFVGLPLFNDHVFGRPFYQNYPAFNRAMDDDLTMGIYCLYVSLIVPLWWQFGMTKRRNGQYLTDQITDEINQNSDFLNSKYLRLTFGLFLISPLFALAAAPEPEAYWNYGAIAMGSLSQEARDYYPTISVSTLLSLIGCAGLLSSFNRLKPLFYLPILAWVCLSAWVNGKRYFVIFSLILIGYIFWQRGYLLGKRLIIAAFLSFLLLFAYSSMYQTAVRGIGANTLSVEGLYENFRIDYGRDHTIKTTIYSELYPERMQILDYRGQTLLFYLTLYVPRSLWPEKPLPYAQYFTSAVFHQPPKLWGWGLTTSILEEAIANFGWFGMIIGPLIPLGICKLGQSLPGTFSKSLSTLIACLFLAVEFSSFAPIFILWLLLYLNQSWTERRAKSSSFSIHLS
jgi:hypothetical protein